MTKVRSRWVNVRIGVMIGARLSLNYNEDGVSI